MAAHETRPSHVLLLVLLMVLLLLGVVYIWTASLELLLCHAGCAPVHPSPVANSRHFASQEIRHGDTVNRVHDESFSLCARFFFFCRWCSFSSPSPSPLRVLRAVKKKARLTCSILSAGTGRADESFYARLIQGRFLHESGRR